MQRVAILLSTICYLFSAVPLARATEYSSTNFKVSNPVIEELGGLATSTSFKLWGSIPFIEPRRASSTTFTSIPGFLGFPGPTTPTPTPSPSPSGGPFLGGYQGIGLPKPKPLPSSPMCQRVDFNRSGSVTFVDFSILLYYFDKQGSIIVPYDLNGDSAVDMVDISIFMYCWDGK